MRYPLEPLARMAGMSNRQTLLALKVSGSSYQQYRDQGMSREVADRMAVRLGFHAYEVWPWMAEDDLAVLGDGTVECAERCGGRFDPVRPNQLYCSPACRLEAKNRRRREADRGPRTCAAEGCHNLYMPPVKLGSVPIYCSVTCRRRENMRTYRQTEAGKHSNRKFTRQYKADVKEILARRSARRAA